MNNRIPISSDAMLAYADAIEFVYGQDVGYAQIVKPTERTKVSTALPSGYGWGYTTTEGGGRRYFTVLELPPVDSPQTAVKAAIMSEIKNARQKSKSR